MGHPATAPKSPYTEAVLDSVFAELWTRGVLTRRERRLITLTCLGACGNQATLDAHLYAALRVGDLSLSELREFVHHFAFYAGFPSAAAIETALDRAWSRWQSEDGPTDNHPTAPPG
jgi:4-carboxymuconolactone decarboxylase